MLGQDKLHGLALHARVTARDISPRLAIRTEKSDCCIESPFKKREREGGREEKRETWRFG